MLLDSIYTMHNDTHEYRLLLPPLAVILILCMVLMINLYTMTSTMNPARKCVPMTMALDITTFRMSLLKRIVGWRKEELNYIEISTYMDYNYAYMDCYCITV